MSYKKNKYMVVRNAMPIEVANFIHDYFVNKMSKEFNNPKVKYDYLNSDKILLKYMKHTDKVNYNIKNYINLFLDQNIK